MHLVLINHMKTSQNSFIHSYKSCHDMSINRATTKLMLLAAVLVVAAGLSALGTMTSSVAYAQEAISNGGHGTPREEPGQQDDPNAGERGDPPTCTA